MFFILNRKVLEFVLILKGTDLMALKLLITISSSMKEDNGPINMEEVNAFFLQWFADIFQLLTKFHLVCKSEGQKALCKASRIAC